MKPRPHADLIKAWADGAAIQRKSEHTSGEWLDTPIPKWCEDTKYRIKPVNTIYYATFKKTDRFAYPSVVCIFSMKEGTNIPEGYKHNLPNLKLVMDDEGKLISAEVL